MNTMAYFTSLALTKSHNILLPSLILLIFLSPVFYAIFSSFFSKKKNKK